MISESPAVYSWNICIAPSWAIWVTPLTNCLRFMLLSWTTLQKCSGANVGIPSYSNFFPPVVSVSPMENRSGSNTPITSPAYASSTIFLSWAISCCGWESLIFLLLAAWYTSMPASNLPEQILINAILSLWALFIFAWILNTKAENGSVTGSMIPSDELRPIGGVVILRK